MSKKTRLMALLLAALCSQTPRARVVSGLGELFALADEQSVSLQAHASGKAAADEALKAAKAQRRPDISLSASVSYLGDGTLWDRDFGNRQRAAMPHFGNNFAIEARQVVYAGGAISGNIELARLGQEVAELDRQAARQEVRFVLAGYYLELCKRHREREVLRHHIALTGEVLARMAARREQGTVLKSDITRYELQKASLEQLLVQAENECRILAHEIATTLHLPEGTEIAPDSLAWARPFELLTEADWQAAAAQNHLGLRRAEAEAEAGEQRVRIERAARRPQVSLVASDHLDGPVTIEVPPLDNNFNYWYVGVGVTYNLSSLFKNGRKVGQARFEAQRARQARQLAGEEVGQAVQAGYTRLLTSLSDLRTQEKSVQLADENYDIVNHRYENGLALLTDLLDASQAKLDADLGLADARIEVAFRYYQMKYLTHTL